MEREAAAKPEPTAEEAEAMRKAAELAEARLKGDEERTKILSAAEESRKARDAEQLKADWNELDEDKSGYLDKSEIKRVLLRMGRADDIDDVMKEVDANGSMQRLEAHVFIHCMTANGFVIACSNLTFLCNRVF